MPLMHGKSKRAFGKNVKTEMEHGKPMKQSLAIAYSVKRKSKKKMAEGGSVPPSAKDEKRPMPESKGQEEVSRNSGKKAPSIGDSAKTAEPNMKQARKGMKTTPIKHPRHVPINGASLRLRDEEDHLEDSAMPASPSEQPEMAMDEKDADRQGPKSKDLSLKMMAEGGKINDAVSMDEAEEDGAEHPAGLEEDNDQIGDDDAMANHMAMLADGGPIDEEEFTDHAASLAAAIMAKRRKKMAEGGEVDLSRNADEEPNNEDQMSFEALKKENYSESAGLKELGEQHSNEIGDEREMSQHDDHDDRLVSAIRRKMKARSAITR